MHLIILEQTNVPISRLLKCDLSLTMSLNLDAFHMRNNLLFFNFVFKLVGTFILTTHLVAECPKLQALILFTCFGSNSSFTPEDLLFH